MTTEAFLRISSTGFLRISPGGFLLIYSSQDPTIGDIATSVVGGPTVLLDSTCNRMVMSSIITSYCVDYQSMCSQAVISSIIGGPA